MNWLKRMWTKLKLAFLGLLASLGLLVIATAQAKTLSWTHPTERVDGTPLAVTEIMETRIYCDGAPAIAMAAPTNAYEFLEGGEHTCYATAVDTFGQESDPSNSITFTILPAKPSAPVLNSL